MSLRTKALLIVGVTLISAIAALYLSSRITLISSLTKIEEQETQKYVQRVLAALSQEISDLERTTADWSSWDDTYAFIEDANSDYVESNLVDETFIALRLNAMLFVHSSGRVVLGKAFDLDNNEEIAVSPSLLEQLSKGGLLVGDSGTGSIVSGVILLDEDPMLVVSQPILTSEDEGPARGTLIFGRYLNVTELERLSRVTLSKLIVNRLDEAMPHDFREALPSLSQQVPIVVRPLSTQNVAGYTLINDVYGEPALMVRVHIARDIFQSAQRAVIDFILVVLGIGLIAGVIVAVIVQKQVLSRFTAFVKGVSDITSTGDTTAHLSVGGRDELALVAGAINGMLAALQESEAELRQRYERERDLRQDLEAEIEKRSEFTRALVHELKTPITPVMAATELLLEEVKEDPLRNLVQSIARSAANLNQRIDELLDMARGEIGQLQLNYVSMDPVRLLQEIAAEMVPVALSNQQSLDLKLPSSLPVLWADKDRLRQVVFNIINNACKFTPAGGHITMRAREDGANLVVEVEDTGRGISDEDQQRLFDPYHRFETDRERLSGLGLGLFLVKRFIELHGGQIWVKSATGKGSTFGFSIPFEAAELAEEGTEQREAL